jgi:hypothetical protein
LGWRFLLKLNPRLGNMPLLHAGCVRELSKIFTFLSIPYTSYMSSIKTLLPSDGSIKPSNTPHYSFF